MTSKVYTGLFLAEGSSDFPLADMVEVLFLDRGVELSLSRPDFSLLGRVPKDVRSRVDAGLALVGGNVDLMVVHRDADNAGTALRRREIENGIRSAGVDSGIVPVVPIRMTEAWLLLDESAIRQIAGNPRGRMPLSLPAITEVERKADPRSILPRCILEAANVTGRRRDRLGNRFNQNRRQLLERLDRDGVVNQLSGWQTLVADVEAVVKRWRADAD
jgi:hypothetical protein